MYNLPQVDESMALQKIPEMIESLYPYLAEMWFRRIEVPKEIQEKLESILGRKGRFVKPVEDLKFLNSGKDDEGGADDDDEDPLGEAMSGEWGDK